MRSRLTCRPIVAFIIIPLSNYTSEKRQEDNTMRYKYQWMCLSLGQLWQVT